MKKPISFNDFVTLYSAYNAYLDKYNVNDKEPAPAEVEEPAPAEDKESAPAADPNAAILEAINALNKKIESVPRPSMEEPKPLNVDDVIKKILS